MTFIEEEIEIRITKTKNIYKGNKRVCVEDVKTITFAKAK